MSGSSPNALLYDTSRKIRSAIGVLYLLIIGPVILYFAYIGLKGAFNTFTYILSGHLSLGNLLGLLLPLALLFVVYEVHAYFIPFLPRFTSSTNDPTVTDYGAAKNH